MLRTLPGPACGAYTGDKLQNDFKPLLAAYREGKTMCGRYTILVTMEELMLLYLSELSGELPEMPMPMYNAAPGQMIPAVINDGKRNRFGQLRWGLLPSWATDERSANKPINARAETLMEKASFKHLIARKRAIIPADGFYEWKKTDDGKQPMRIGMRDGSVFSMAALYDTWVGPDGRKISTCVIITTEANELVSDIHDRMPVILRPEDCAFWLDRNNTDIRGLLNLLVPYDAGKMRAYPVSPAVGSVKNDGPELIVEYHPEKEEERKSGGRRQQRGKQPTQLEWL